MGEAQHQLLGDGHQLIAEAFSGVPVAGIGQVRPEDSNCLEAFQAAFAAADEWQALGLIELLECEDCYGSSLVHPIRFRRLK